MKGFGRLPAARGLTVWSTVDASLLRPLPVATRPPEAPEDTAAVATDSAAATRSEGAEQGRAAAISGGEYSPESGFRGHRCAALNMSHWARRNRTFRPCVGRNLDIESSFRQLADSWPSLNVLTCHVIAFESACFVCISAMRAGAATQTRKGWHQRRVPCPQVLSVCLSVGWSVGLSTTITRLALLQSSRIPFGGPLKPTSKDQHYCQKLLGVLEQRHQHTLTLSPSTVPQAWLPFP
jgi:hypothetical protein